MRPGQSLTEIPVQSQTGENIEWNGETAELQVGEDASITLTLDVPADCELYLELEGLEILDVRHPGLTIRVWLTSGAATGACRLSPEGFVLNANRDSVLANVGYDENARTTVEIRFAHAGRYRLSAIRAYAQPMADFDEKIAALQSRGLTDVRLEPMKSRAASRWISPP